MTSSLAVGRFAAKEGSHHSPRGRLVASLTLIKRKVFRFYMCEDLLRHQKDFLPAQAKTFSTENSKAPGKILKKTKRNETNILSESL